MPFYNVFIMGKQSCCVAPPTEPRSHCVSSASILSLGHPGVESCMKGRPLSWAHEKMMEVCAPGSLPLSGGFSI